LAAIEQWDEDETIAFTQPVQNIQTFNTISARKIGEWGILKPDPYCFWL
jgi:hypothetical protein